MEEILKDELKDEELENKESTEKKDSKDIDEEFEKRLQSETDRRVTSAISKAREKWEAEFEEKRSEAEKLASMSAEERAKAEFEKEKSAWLKEKEEFEGQKMKLEATKLLSEEKLPITFVDYIIAGTAEEVKENVSSLKENWQKALDEAVADKLKGKAPAGSGLQNKDIVNMTKEEFGKLPYKERAQMLNIDPDFVSKLKK